MTPADLAAIAARVAIAPPERLAIDVTTLLAHIAALTAERDAALSRATGAEARAEALREAARECAAWVGAEPQSDEWDGGVRACVGSIADLAAKGGA